MDNFPTFSVTDLKSFDKRPLVIAHFFYTRKAHFYCDPSFVDFLRVVKNADLYILKGNAPKLDDLGDSHSKIPSTS